MKRALAYATIPAILLTHSVASGQEYGSEEGVILDSEAFTIRQIFIEMAGTVAFVGAAAKSWENGAPPEVIGPLGLQVAQNVFTFLDIYGQSNASELLASPGAVYPNLGLAYRELTYRAFSAGLKIVLAGGFTIYAFSAANPKSARDAGWGGLVLFCMALFDMTQVASARVFERQMHRHVIAIKSWRPVAEAKEFLIGPMSYTWRF